MKTSSQRSRPKARFATLLLALLAVQTAQAENWTYIVEDGDNLWDIAARHLNLQAYWRKLQILNHVDDPFHIPPGTPLQIPVNWLRQQAVSMTVQNVTGTVEVLTLDRTDTQTVTVGDALGSNQVLRTGPDSSVTLSLPDGSKVLLQADSQLNLQALGEYGSTGILNTQMALEKGRLETQVTRRKDSDSRYKISTPALVTSVRGTQYRVGTDPSTEESQTEVVEGKIAVDGHGATRNLPSGYGLVGSPEKSPSPPIKLLDSPKIEELESFDRVPIQFKLPSLAGAVGYRIQIARTQTFDEILFDQKQTGEQIHGPDLPDGEYWLRVRGIDAHGLEGLNAESKFLLNARPPAPFPLEPKPGSGVAEESPTFTWSRLATAKSYHFQIASDAAFGHVLVDSTPVPDPRLSPDKKLKLGTYFWRVSSIEEQEGEGPYSDPQEFRRVPPAPQAEEPEIGDETMEIRWRSGSEGQQYQFQLADEESFAQPLIDSKTSEPKLNIPTPDAGTYFVRIRTIDPDGFVGPFGPPQSIDVPHSPYWWLMALPLFALFAI